MRCQIFVFSALDAIGEAASSLDDPVPARIYDSKWNITNRQLWNHVAIGKRRVRNNQDDQLDLMLAVEQWKVDFPEDLFILKLKTSSLQKIQADFAAGAYSIEQMARIEELGVMDFNFLDGLVGSELMFVHQTAEQRRLLSR